MKRVIYSVTVVVALTLILTGCFAKDPKKEIVSELKSNPIVSDAVISVKDKEVTVEIEITGDQDSMEVLADFRDDAEKIKSRYSDKKVIVWLKRNGEKFGSWNY